METGNILRIIYASLRYEDKTVTVTNRILAMHPIIVDVKTMPLLDGTSLAATPVLSFLPFNSYRVVTFLISLQLVQSLFELFGHFPAFSASLCSAAPASTMGYNAQFLCS